MMRIIFKIYTALLAGLGLAAGIAIAGLAVSITGDVVGRNLGLGNFPWLLEVSEYVLFGVTFLAAPWVLRESAHVRVDVLVSNLPEHLKRPLNLSADILGFLISAILTWYALRVMKESLERGDLLFKELVVPEWPFFALAAFAGGLLIIEFTLRLIGSDMNQTMKD